MLSIQDIYRKKDELQSSAFKTWVEAGARGVFVWATGVGKTRLATHYAIPRMNEKAPGLTTNVVIPKTFLKEAWEGTGRQKGYIQQEGLKDVEAWVVNSYVKQRHANSLLVLDEIHRYSNEETAQFRRVLDVTKAPYVLGLTATLTKEQEKFLAARGIPVLGTITTRDAEAMGLISPYKVYNIPVQLSDTDRQLEREIHDQFVHFASKFNRDRDLAFECASSINPRWNPLTEQWYDPPAAKYARDMGWNGIPLEEAVQNYRHRKAAPRGARGAISIWEDEHDDFEFTPSKINYYAQRYIKFMNARQDFLHTAVNKLEMVQKIVNQFPDKKIIVFSQRTIFADRITNMLGNRARSYHSNLESSIMYDDKGAVITYKSGAKKGQPKMFGVKSLKDQILSDFRAGKFNVLSTALALDEGFDVEGIDMAIIASATSKDRQNTQRIGRAIRAQEGKVAVIVNLFVPDSQDVTWLESRQKYDKPARLIKDVTEINFDHEEGRVIATKTQAGKSGNKRIAKF